MSLLLLFGGIALIDEDDPTSDKPIIGIDNVVTTANVAADAAHADYPASNLANSSTNLRWQGTSTATQYLIVTTGSAQTIDYVGIARHNFGSGAVTVSVEGDSGAGYATIYTAFVPDDDGPLFLRFTPGTFSGIRVKLVPTATIPRAAVLYLGKLLTIPRRVYQGHTPIVDGRKVRVTNGRSESGEFLGRIVLGEWFETTASFSLVDPTYFREHIREALLDAKETPFFWNWRPVTYPRESGYSVLISDPKPVNAAPSGLVAFDLQMSSVV